MMGQRCAGIGHLAKQGDGFRYYPEGMVMRM
jgi:hypothetical protein